MQQSQPILKEKHGIWKETHVRMSLIKNEKEDISQSHYKSVRLTRFWG